MKGDHISMSQALLSEMGEVYTIQEEQMDIFTGIAGSGPAYFYFLMERIEEAGEEAGLSKELSRQIGAQTLLGAENVARNRGKPFYSERENYVTKWNNSRRTECIR